uniref:Uncharacterized protein n=1 Tax=Dromaius novaehollandiae TaxID=8790 RepID=A0A8C4JRJ2_DRONO
PALLTSIRSFVLILSPAVGGAVVCNNLTVENFVLCHSHLVFTYILATVPFLKALFVSFTFLVWIILKYEIHL